MLCLVALCLPSAVRSLELEFPAQAALVQNSGPAQGQHPIATGPFDGAQVPLDLADGLVQTTIWQLSGENVSTASILQAIREQISEQGYEIDFTCFADACGGFDFRHSVPVGQAPEMHVDLGNFQYLSATTDGNAGPERLAVMISRGGAQGFVHLVHVSPTGSGVVAPVVQSSRSPDAAAQSPFALSADDHDLIARLTTAGAAPLDDLQFEVGASQLSGDTYQSLEVLAAFLRENPARRVVLVGHTDASGSLSGNIALSEARAEAVRRFLTGELDVNPSQVEAEGIGYLSPRAPNTTSEGREANRRVEVVLATAS